LAVCTLVYAVLIALALRNTPQDVGLQPYGASTLPSAVGIAGRVAAAPPQDWTVRRAIRLAFVFSLVALYGAMAGFWLATRRLATAGHEAPAA
jgi:hypothetical protein